jgi:hypothetical protein
VKRPAAEGEQRAGGIVGLEADAVKERSPGPNAWRTVPSTPATFTSSPIQVLIADGVIE